MRITDLLDKRSISLDGTPKTKSQALDAMVELMVRSGKIQDPEAYRKQVYAREEESTTGIGGGIAIPHGKCDAVTRPGLAAMVVKDGVEFESLDGAPATLLFLIAAPDTEDNIHLDVLSKLSVLLMDGEFTEALRNAGTPEEFLEIIDRADTEKKSIDERLADTGAPEKGGSRLLAVTSCPTGIAHTYMAADGLKYAAEELGYDFKVEPQGSSGGDKLTQAEIDEADAVVFAVALPVRGRERFAGKPYVEAPVKRGIDEPKAMIEEALAEAEKPNGKRVAAGAADSSETAEEGGTWGTRIYKALMTGVSYMIPFVAAGGIILAIGFMLEAITMPNLGDVDTEAILSGASLTNLGDTPLSLYLGAALHTIGAFGLGAMVPILAAYIAYGLAQRPGIAPGFIAGSVAVMVGGGFLGGIVAGLLAGLCAYWLSLLKLPRWLASMMPVVITPLVATLFAGGLMFFLLGGPLAWVTTSLENWLNSMTGASAILLGIILGAMMGFDLGGPVNKAAYLFATAGLSAGTLASQQVMAAVIISGMVPPLAMALATAVRPKLFSAPERENGKAAWLLGASFISEGAIPFATADPLRVIPSSVVGAAVAGAISMGAGVASPAPHGGVWIIALVENPLMFLVAAIAGTVVGALMYIVLKSLAGRKAEATA